MRLKIAATFIFTILWALSCASSAVAQSSAAVVKAQGYASVDGVKPDGKFKIAIALDVASGYHINAHVPSEDYLVATNVKFADVAGLKIADVKYPKAKLQKFEFSDKELAVLDGKVFMTAEATADRSIQPGTQTIKATVTVQSCNDRQCLAPSDLTVEIPVTFVASTEASKVANAEIFAKATAQPIDDTPVPAGDKKDDAAALTQFKGNDSADKNSIASLLESQGLLLTLPVIFLAGLALNLTPCVYPIIPITIGFFANQGSADGKPNIKRTFAMASLYVFGMAITYSILGVVASLTGGLFGAALQSPFVLIGLAVLMVALSLSMFGVYEFKLPESLNRFANNSSQSSGGMFGALIMGLTMGIVAAPCIGPFVVALLVEVSRRGDPVFGFLLFFVLALGLGFPYLFLGTFSGSLKAMPRSGLWMVTVRKVFGFILIGMALYFLRPLMGKAEPYIFVAFFAISAIYLLFFEAAKAKPVQFAWVLRVIGIAAAAAAIFFALPKKTEASIEWQPYSEQAVLEAQKQGKGVIIDTFATWCIPCKELDEFTFTDAKVKQEAEKYVTLKLDLTNPDDNSDAGRAREKFKIIGVPTILFLDAKGNENPKLRLEGFEKPDKFLARLQGLGAAPASNDLAANTAVVPTAVSDGASGAGAATNGEFEPAPALALNLLDGGKLDLASLKGKVVLVDFWATWCVPCISEIPMFNELTKQYKPQGFEMIATSLDEEGASIVKPFLKRYPMNYTQTLGDATVAEQFKVTEVLPVAILIDKQGRIRFTHKGITKKEVFEEQIKQLLSE